MPLSNPMTNGPAYGAPPAAAPAPQRASQGHSAGDILPKLGTGGLKADHNLPLHVAVLVLLGLGTVALLQMGGFRFVFDAGLGKR